MLERKSLFTKDKNSMNHHVYINAEVVHTYSSSKHENALKRYFIISIVHYRGSDWWVVDWELMKNRSYI